MTSKATLGLLIFLVRCSDISNPPLLGKLMLTLLQILWNIIILGVAGATLTQVSVLNDFCNC